MKAVQSLKLVLGAMLFVACAATPRSGQSESAPANAAGADEHQLTCDSGPRECTAFRGTGFVEAYVRFMYASPNELADAFPLTLPMDRAAPAQVPRIPPVAEERGEFLRDTLPGLTCFSISEQELDALADTLGVPRPKRKGAPPDPKLVAERVKALTGWSVSEEAVSEMQDLPRSHLVPVRYSPACAKIYQIPSTILDRLAAEPDEQKLGDRWLASIRAAGPNPAAFQREPNQPDSREDPREWRAAARDLIHLARLRNCGSRNLYVEIMYDC
ncbi:MAG: hypothetical protein R3B13_16525 [Polyangiaceae bacterium]